MILPSGYRGCDHWTGRDYCGDYAPHLDEVSELRFCQLHAGALAMSDRDINLYSAALRIGGHLDMPVPVPQLNAERAA